MQCGGRLGVVECIIIAAMEVIALVEARKRNYAPRTMGRETRP